MAAGLMAAPFLSAVSLIQRAKASPLGAVSSSTWHTGRRARNNGLAAGNGSSTNTSTVVGGRPGIASTTARHAPAAESDAVSRRAPRRRPPRDSVEVSSPSTTIKRWVSRNGSALATLNSSPG